MENKLLETPKEAGLRDAIHVPIISAIASEDITDLYVNIDDNGRAYNCDEKFAVGYVAVTGGTGKIKKGDIFWIMILPGKVVSLTHNFVLWSERNNEVKNKDNDEVLALKSKIERLESELNEIKDDPGYEQYHSCRGCY